MKSIKKGQLFRTRRDAHGDRHARAGCAAQDASPHVLRSEQLLYKSDIS